MTCSSQYMLLIHTSLLADSCGCIMFALSNIGNSCQLDIMLIRSLLNTSTQSDGPTLSAEKICLSISHLVPEILGPKVGLIFHLNVFFNRF